MQSSSQGSAREQEWERLAYQLGADAARATASWITDGNDTDESRRLKLQTIEDDGPDSILTRPNLSGEWADALTPLALFEQVTGLDAETAWNTDAGVVEALAVAYEQAVDDTFEDACLAELRRWLDPVDHKPTRMYVVSVVLECEHRSADGVTDVHSYSIQVPTFYLLADVQGIMHEDHARAIAEQMFERTENLIKVHACAVETSMLAHGGC